MLTEKSFDTGEVTLSYIEGTVSGPPMVLLHGLTLWRQSWDVMIPHLLSNWHVYAIDLRGHGKSDRSTEYHVIDYMRDIVAFLRQVGEPVVLVGHSLGALTTIAVAAEYPEGVRAIVPVDPPLFLHASSIAILSQANDWFSWVYETMKDSPSYDAVVAKCRETLPPDASDANVEPLADMVYGVAAGAAETVLDNQLLEGLDLGSALQKIKCPTLVLQGDWANGGAMRDEDAEFVRANLPTAEVVFIPNGSHLYPDQFADIVLQHLNAFLSSG